MKRSLKKSRRVPRSLAVKRSGAASRVSVDQRLLDAEKFLLPTYNRQQVEDTISAENLGLAQQIVERLADAANQ